MADDSSPGKPPNASIPPWQRAHVPKDGQQQQPDQPPQTDSPAAPSVESAAKFLDDASIKNAPRERKRAFLQAKGIPSADIDKLLDSTPEEKPEQEPTVVHSQPTKAPPQTRPRSDVPPIVTYPEFLVQPQKPPPLVTTQRLLNTAYVTGALMATMYGLSKYVIEPMSDTLASARHDFFEHSTALVADLNSRLEKSVSMLPPDSKISGPAHGEYAEPPSPTDSDPTELFHRDVGTQTTADLEKPSESPCPPPAENESAVSYHESRIRSLAACISDLKSSTETHELVDSDLKTELNDLTSRLHQMSYRGPSYDLWPSYGADGGKAAADKSSGKASEDEIDRIKAEIRSVKGVLLSARNFPGARVR